MIIRIACFTVPVVAVASLIACAAPEVSGNGSDEVNESKKEPKTASDAGTTATGKTGSAASPASVDGGKAPSKTPTTKGASDPSTTAGESACVAKCNAQVKAKCQGEDDFCDVICVQTSTAFVDCLAAAAACSKPEWIACDTQFPSDPDKGEKK